MSERSFTVPHSYSRTTVYEIRYSKPSDTALSAHMRRLAVIYGLTDVQVKMLRLVPELDLYGREPVTP